MAKVVAAAAAAGVTDLHAALAELAALESSLGERLSAAERYVEAREQEDSLTNIAAHGTSMLLLDSTTAGLELNHKGSDASILARVREKLRQAATKLSLGLGGWEKGSALYQAALRSLRRRAIEKYQELVEQQVFKRKILIQRMDRIESGNSGNKLRKTVASLTGCVLCVRAGGPGTHESPLASPT